MSPAPVTLASALQVRGGALSEEEIWSLLLLAAEKLQEDVRDDASDYVVCPWSTLLSVTGSLSFHDHISLIEAAPFKAPELLQGQSDGEQPDASQRHVYSLGMTLYWSAGFCVPPNQPLQLCESLHSLLLTMCEDQPCRRLPLQSVLEACWAHQEKVAGYPASASHSVRQLVTLVLDTISQVERRVVEEKSFVQQDRSYLLRARLHQASCERPFAENQECQHPGGVSERSTETQSSLEPDPSSSTHSHCGLSVNSAFPAEVSQGLQEGRKDREEREGWEGREDWRFSSGSGSALSVVANNSLPASPSQMDFLKRKGKFSRPEFLLLARESPVTLHLPGSIVTKKGKSYLALKDICVVLLSGQCLEVKCDGTATVGAIFSTVTAFANLVEHPYFGLAYMKDKEFFFLDNETRLSKIALEDWSERPHKKTSWNTFTLFLRIKFFVSHCELLQQSQTRHQFYLQLRRDILEDKLCCEEEMLLRLAVLALQAEFGSYPEEQVETKAYFRAEDYIPVSLIERMTIFRAQVQLSEMHRLSPALWGEDAELEFLRVTQQLPEYGVLIHRVLPDKPRSEGEKMALGICAKGVVVYEVKNNSRIATIQFHWREIGKISTYRKKFTITSSITGKKHTFVTDSAKTCRYLLGLCSAQHRFNAQLSSQGIATDCYKWMQMANPSLAQLTPSKPLTWIQKLPCTGTTLFKPRLEGTAGSLPRKLLATFDEETTKEKRTEKIGSSTCTVQEQLQNICLLQKPMPVYPDSGPPVQSTCTDACQAMDQVLGKGSLAHDTSSPSSGIQSKRRKSFSTVPDGDIVCVTLSRDPCHGFGFVINDGEDAGKACAGIFISSIIPGGPADNSKKLQPGGQILALNHISLEGFTFNMAVRMIQNSPDKIELLISQPKDGPSNGDQGRFSSHMQDQERSNREQEVTGLQSFIPTPRPQLSFLQLKGAGSCPLAFPEVNANEIYFVELVKEDGTLGFSVTGGINTSVPYGGIYVKSIVPGGPAAKEGQILCGDRLLQVDGVSLGGLTHKQAVQCLKGTGQVARLALERRGPRAAQQWPSANDRMGDEDTAVSLATALPGRPPSCVSATDGPKFEVKLKKNACGLGFSFVQMEGESCGHLKNYLVRIKRLFPGQPAEENGAIAVGDIILAVNGRPTEGLIFQEVLHLLRGASQEVTLLLCRPPPGVLPEMDQGWQTPVFSADQEFFREACAYSEHSPRLDQEDFQRNSVSPDAREGLGFRSESFQRASREAQWDQEQKSSWAASLMYFQDPHPHLCKRQQEMDPLALATALEKDMRQNCYSVCDIRRLESLELHQQSEEVCVCHPSEAPPSTMKDEVYLAICSTSRDQLPCGECLEADSETIPLPQFSSWGALSESLPQEEFYDNESEWEDLEEALDPADGVLR